MSPQPLDSMVCQECHMLVTPGNAYHPHLFCVLWKAYHLDPEVMLAAAGWVRTADVMPDIEKVRYAWHVPGPRPDLHQAAQDRLRRGWSTLAKALDGLAPPP